MTHIITIATNADCTVDGVNKGHFLDVSHNDSQGNGQGNGGKPGGALHADMKAAVDLFLQGLRDEIASRDRIINSIPPSAFIKATP